MARARPMILVQRFWRLPSTRRRLLMEAGIALLQMAWRVRCWRFSRLAATLGLPVPPPAAVSGDAALQAPGPDSQAVAMAQDVRWAIAAASRVLRPRPTCLMQAAAAQRLLARRALASQLCFGVQSTAASTSAGATQPGHALQAHAWLHCSGLTVTGEQEAAHFRPIVVYHLTPEARRQ